eukprot:8522811-Pyramimonas_sp.AAC.2
MRALGSIANRRVCLIRKHRHQAQGRTRPMFVAAVVAAIFQVPACYWLVKRLGYLGAPLALFLSNLIVLACLLVSAAQSPAAVRPVTVPLAQLLVLTSPY